MKLLLDEETIYRYTNWYVDFIKKWYSFYSLCIAQYVKPRERYEQEFNSLRSIYFQHIIEVLGSQKIVEKAKPTKIIRDIDKLLAESNCEFVTIRENIIRVMDEFTSEEEQSFRDLYHARYMWDEARRGYSSQLAYAVNDLLDAYKFDEAVVSAFKTLDKHLRDILKIEDFELYGEKLINEAFGKNGKLHLDTHDGEQSGLRNLVSGANALFRNSAAHREVRFSKSSAQAVIALVALVMRLSTSVADRKGLLLEVDKKKMPFYQGDYIEHFWG
jgi:uncharacterized protein (TIGR02391 family)